MSSVTSWSVSRMPTTVAAFKDVASLLEEWKCTAREAKQFEVCEIAGLASWRLKGCADILRSQEVSTKDMEKQVGVVAINSLTNKTHAIAVWRILSCGTMQLDFLATPPDSVETKVHGAASAALEYLKAQVKKIRLTATPTSVSFYEKHGFSLEEDSQVFMVFPK